MKKKRIKYILIAKIIINDEISKYNNSLEQMIMKDEILSSKNLKLYEKIIIFQIMFFSTSELIKDSSGLSLCLIE